jgi:nitrogen fixation/metabolism regulation signal transduction histidine kinase
LGKRNEHIAWNKQDEIGELVSEYNRMVDELAVSADKLARSEREGAWRDMAKQVAHEIKNPLTPMKLSIQHLQRAWRENDPRATEMQNRVADTLISQIDSLANIATAFADFARMPDKKSETVNLNELLKQSIELFEGIEETEIVMNIPQNECLIVADKDQLSRVFSNLLKNALQSIPKDRKGRIEVNLLSENSNYRIEVRDNGSGIADNIKSIIFSPNFTTKNSGMGLGLAMAKSIVQEIGGEIGFETQDGSGSVFYIILPKANS